MLGDHYFHNYKNINFSFKTLSNTNKKLILKNTNRKCKLKIRIKKQSHFSIWQYVYIKFGDTGTYLLHDRVVSRS